MSFLIDTDIASAYMRNHSRVVSRVMMHFGGLYVSAVSVGELMVWAARARAPASRRVAVDDLLAGCHIVPIDRAIAERFGEIRAAMLDAGRPVGVLDLMNAAVALVHGLTVVTHNVADYKDVPGLMIADWMVP